MSPEKLALMANQIATALRHKGDGAAQATADHIHDFWEPRMRAELLEMIAASDPRLSETVHAAGACIRAPSAA